MNQITKKLFSLSDSGYAEFQRKLMPTVDPKAVIGVRTPLLRKLAKEIFSDSEKDVFLNELPHKYYEENNLHAFLIEQIKDFDTCIKSLNDFLPFVDNWATCDCMNPKCFKTHTGELLPHIDRWINSKETYTVRFGIKCLMNYYLDGNFSKEYPEKILKIESDEYYINMMIAWYFATALAKQWDRIIPYIENRRLPIRVHNKAIQKATESYRITDEQKAYLRKLKIKN